MTSKLFKEWSELPASNPIYPTTIKEFNKELEEINQKEK